MAIITVKVMQRQREQQSAVITMRSKPSEFDITPEEASRGADAADAPFQQMKRKDRRGEPR